MTSMTLLNALALSTVALLVCALVSCPGTARAQAADDVTPTIVSVKKIWDRGAHNAFTDLIRFKDEWYCSFREGDGHVGCASPTPAAAALSFGSGGTHVYLKVDL